MLAFARIDFSLFVRVSSPRHCAVPDYKMPINPTKIGKAHILSEVNQVVLNAIKFLIVVFPTF